MNADDIVMVFSREALSSAFDSLLTSANSRKTLSHQVVTDYTS